MKKFLLNIENSIIKLFPYDKSLHFICGEGISFIISFLLLFLFAIPFYISVAIALLITFLVALGKEKIFDEKMKNEKADYVDIIYTVIGGLMVSITQILTYIGVMTLLMIG